MVNGQQVTVRLYGGSTALRRVVSVKRDVIVVCAEEEYQKAKIEGRDASGLGFPYEDVVEAVPTRKAVSSEIWADHERSQVGD